MPRPKAPYFPFYAKDALTDPRIMFLSHVEFGVLCRLWSWMWINDIVRGALFVKPKVAMSDEKIAEILRLDLAQLQKYLLKLVDEEGILKRGKYGELYSPRQRKHKTKYELYGSQTETKRKRNGKQKDENLTIREGKGREEKKREVKEREPKTTCSRIPKPEFLERAEKLKSLILTNNVKAKIPKCLDSWGNDVRLMVEQDKRTLGEIDKTIEFSQKDQFWKMVILSMGNFREKFDKIWLKSQSQEIKNGTPKRANISDGSKFTKTGYSEIPQPKT